MHRFYMSSPSPSVVAEHLSSFIFLYVLSPLSNALFVDRGDRIVSLQRFCRGRWTCIGKNRYQVDRSYLILKMGLIVEHWLVAIPC